MSLPFLILIILLLNHYEVFDELLPIQTLNTHLVILLWTTLFLRLPFFFLPFSFIFLGQQLCCWPGTHGTRRVPMGRVFFVCLYYFLSFFVKFFSLLLDILIEFRFRNYFFICKSVFIKTIPHSSVWYFPGASGLSPDADVTQAEHVSHTEMEYLNFRKKI